MKIVNGFLIIIISVLCITGCNGRKSLKKSDQSTGDTVTVPDTGYTGIKQGMSGHYIVNEITYKNGVKNGLMKTFYVSGKLRQTFWYENGLREDSSRWFYEEGQLFRTTPYKHDTVNGIQKQYYRTGRLKAKIGYINGLRTPFFEEYTSDGKLVTGYPQVVVNTTDEYRSKGLYRINLSLSDKSVKVRFYKGELAGGVFDTTRCERIKTLQGTGKLILKKSNTSNPGYMGVIAEILTDFGNNQLVYKKIDLPYKDLN